MSLNADERPLLTKYRELRLDLAGDDEALEIKHEGKGVISWTARGQLGIESKIKATTGFQTYGYDHTDLVTLFKEVLKSN